MNSMNQTPGMAAGTPQQATNLGGDPGLVAGYGSNPQFSGIPLGAPMPSNGMFTETGQTPDQEPTNYGNEPPLLRKYLEAVNIAEELEEDRLNEIGNNAHRGFMADLQSRKDWETHLDEWTKLATQVKEEKTYPWPKSSNIKYPLLATAAMQFAARAYPSLIPSDGRIVKAEVIGKDPTGAKQQKAERTSIYTSYQLMKEMDGWEEDMDKLLIMVPIIGTIFKKTYWDKLTQKNVSCLVLPKNLVVNYWSKSLKTCERISEIIEMSPRALKERQNAGIFLDIDLGRPPQPEQAINAPSNDQTTPYTLIEQHTFLDLDDDGYEEPYIVTFHKESKKILRIVARFDEDGLHVDATTDKIIRIEPIEYYTKFGFIPNPDGSLYDIGFGMLLGPLNESVNTLINQLVDSGSLSNLQSGFIGKGLRIRMGEQRFQPGEWKAVNATADDLHKQILPLPTKEPSAVLFQLMGALITSGKELASVAEIFTGKMPGQNTPATTTMATVEQGMKVFTAVYKRLYRALSEEFKKLYRLNEVYLNPQTYVEILDTNVDPNDFKTQGYDICPGADPSAISQTERLLKAQGLVEMLPMGVLDPMQVTIRMLQAQEQPNWQQLIHPQAQQTGQPVQQPDPKMLQMQAQLQAEQQKLELQRQHLMFNDQLKAHDKQFQQAMAAQKQQQDAEFKDRQLQLQEVADTARLHAKMAADHVQTVQTLAHKQETHAQQLVHKQQQHGQKMVHAHQEQQTKQESLKSQQHQTSKTGNKTR